VNVGGGIIIAVGMLAVLLMVFMIVVMVRSMGLIGRGWIRIWQGRLGVIGRSTAVGTASHLEYWIRRQERVLNDCANKFVVEVMIGLL